MTTLPAATTTLQPASLTVADATVALGGADVLRGAALTLPAGRTLALLGPSGCGKTTLLRCVAGLQRLDGGSIELGGADITRVPAERRQIGMVFQDGALFPHLDVAANIAFGLPRSRRRDGTVEATLRMVGLDGMGRRMPATLSGGQQQRVAIARAVAAQPRLLLLDEPFSSLDASLRAQVRADVSALLADLGVSSVIVTHDQEEAFLLGDEVAVMIDGQILQQAAPADLYAAPATREVADFLGEANVLAGTADGSAAATRIGTIPLREPASGPVAVLVRPEHLRLYDDGDLVVQRVEFYGHDAITCLDGYEQTLRVRTLSAPDLRIGDRRGVRYSGPPAPAFPASADRDLQLR